MTFKTHIEADSYFITKGKYIIKIFNIIQNENTGDIIFICKQFETKSELFIKPIKSSELDIYVVKNLSNNFYEYTIKEIEKKIICLHSNNDLIVLPIIHTTCNFDI